jgi:hypothetical protein
MRDENENKRERIDAAKAAAPYCHARLASTELSGPSGEPVEVEYTSKLDISALSEAELDALESALEKTVQAGGSAMGPQLKSELLPWRPCQAGAVQGAGARKKGKGRRELGP